MIIELEYLEESWRPKQTPLRNILLKQVGKTCKKYYYYYY